MRYEGKRGGAGWACMVVATINSCRDHHVNAIGYYEEMV